MKEKIWIISTLFLFIMFLSVSALGVSCSTATPLQPTQVKAAIIDQLGSLFPNRQFNQTITHDLEKAGFTVTIFKEDQVTVDFYQKLPSLGFKLIIFRTHSGLLRYGKSVLGETYLFTGELYEKSKYLADQFAERVVRAAVDENSQDYFAVSSDFISRSGRGQFNQSVIIMEGCNSLVYADMAEAFISRGALLYTGWTASVDLAFVDDFTMSLIVNLCIKGYSFKDALYQTADQKGIDPASKAKFSYYPTENENYSLTGMK